MPDHTLRYHKGENPSHCPPYFLMVKARSTALRLVVNYEELNKQARNYSRSLPCMEHALECISSYQDKTQRAPNPNRLRSCCTCKDYKRSWDGTISFLLQNFVISTARRVTVGVEGPRLRYPQTSTHKHVTFVNR